MALWTEPDYGVIADKACWALFAVTTVIVGLRIYCRVHFSRMRQTRGLGADDYITLLCLAVFLVTCILVTIGSHYGLGRHMTDVAQNPENLKQALRYNVIISSVLIWTFSLPKFAVVATLQRILRFRTKTSTLFWGLAVSSQMTILATSVWWFCQCSPVEYGWDQSIDGECADVSILADLGYFTSAYSAFLDIFFAIYPIPFIMRLKMPLKTRIAVSCALGMGVLACVISIYKLAIFGQVFAILATDPTYPVPFLDIMGVSEGAILLICTSLSTLGPLYRAGRTKLSDAYGSKPGTKFQSRGGQSHGRTLQGNTKDEWENLKGHKLEEGNQNSRPSTDVIPLVDAPAGSQKSVRESQYTHEIHKTVEIQISSESMAYPVPKTRGAPSL
ncbi:hypothetical protein F4778DRAFT_635747 [Xylariomycetidae sp. FL2044]|nr:hypothetical protein F4778DRAFT_635747 [Xylariomycetidae sp. FL2044]